MPANALKQFSLTLFSSFPHAFFLLLSTVTCYKNGHKTETWMYLVNADRFSHVVWTDGIHSAPDSVSSLTFCASPGPAVKFSQTDQSNTGTELLPVVPSGRTVSVLHHLLPQHGAQLHQQDPLWYLLKGQSVKQAKHEGISAVVLILVEIILAV